MNPIMFRAWHEELQQMFYCSPFSNVGAERHWHSIIGEILMPDHEGRRPEEYLSEPEVYIGRHDKNSMRIYEGDIILGSFIGQGGEWTQQAIVIFMNGEVLLRDCDGNVFDFTHPKFQDPEWRVIIGNIHENKNLLKVNRNGDEDRESEKD